MTEYIYLIMEKDSTVMSAHRTREGANTQIVSLQGTWPNQLFWIDVLKVKD